MDGIVGIAVIKDFEVVSTTAADRLFQAGSLSKTVTAALALELVERGEFDLDSEIRGTTLRDLLGHTAGEIAGRFRYSGGGYAVVQRLIGGVTGELFAETARRVILEPLRIRISSYGPLS